MRAKWRTVAVRSAAGPTMKPGVSHRNSTGRPKASHSCRKRAALSAPSASIAPPRWVGSLATTPSGRPSRRASAVTMPGAEAAAQLEHRALVEQRVDHAAHVVDALALLGDQLPQQALVGHRPRGRPGRGSRRGSAWPRRRPRGRRRRAGRPRRWRPGRRSGRPRRARTRRARRPRSSPGRPCRCSSPRWRSPRRSSRAARRCRRSSSRRRCRPAAPGR